jgi:hypothetical protein
MGFNLQCILIHPATEMENEEILSKLGIDNYEKIEDQPFEIAMSDIGNSYVGSYKNNTIIIDSDLTEPAFDSPNLSEAEKKLVNLFPNAEIFYSILISSMNFYAYSIIKNGQKIRIKSGSSESGVTLDVGEPLKEEMEILANSKVLDDKRRIYWLKENEHEFYEEDQVGENFVFNLFERYTGEKLNMDDDIFETELYGWMRIY